jgi:anthranilate phosphoribosyltransferase
MTHSFLNRLISDSASISQKDYFAYLRMILDNQVSKPEVAAFITALSSKPINFNDILCFVRFIESISPRATLQSSPQAINIVGTGGGIPTFNISTAAAFVACAAGAKVIKSGSYRYNSQSGSLDVLKAIGINLQLDAADLERMLEELGIGFVGPNMYSSLLRRVAISILPLELKQIGGFINTIGPLICPIAVKGQLTGVRNLSLFHLISDAMRHLNLHNSIVVWSEIGLDEFASFGRCHVAHIGSTVRKETIDHQAHGFQLHEKENLRGGDAWANAALIKAIFENKVKNEARDTVAVNSAYILYLAEVVETIAQGIERSLEVIQNGSAKRLLHDAVAFGHDHAASPEQAINFLSK